MLKGAPLFFFGTGIVRRWYNFRMDLKDRKLKLTPKRIEALHALGIDTAEQLLEYYPFRYEVLNTAPFSSWKPKDKVTFDGEVVSAVRSWRYGRNRSVSKFDVMTDDLILHVTIYNRPWAKQLKLNSTITVSGIYAGKNQVTAMTYTSGSMQEQPAVTPVYSVRSGIQQRTVRECIRHALEAFEDRIPDEIPESLRRRYRLEHRETALHMIHNPASAEEIRQAYRTIKYEEFLRFFLAVQMMKEESGTLLEKEPREFDRSKIEELIKDQPFELTPDQRKAIDDILADMASDHVMYRLVQGDVGCGKTFVACAALYAAVLSGRQAALLAPTEILARQHEASIRPLLEPRGVRTAVLYSGEKPAEKKRILNALAAGEIDLIIGTHSILQEGVVFRDLGMVAADEQQRFGVEQRRALREKGTMVDFLLMSATPIPRTLAATLYGDMDVSTIETMPAGRKPVRTELIKENSFRTVLADVKTLLAEGHQLYVICAAVEESEEYDARDAVKTEHTLRKVFAPDYKTGLLHGRMSSEEKQEVMAAFYRNDFQILVSTTVVEVGMNVVNATGMIVYDADRFGLSQLHQLRGRVQRGSSQGVCWLLTDSKEEHTLERLEVLVRSSNGFEISYEDLRLRGPGDILGTRQSGVPDFVLGNIVEDTNIINTARKDAAEIFAAQDLPENQEVLASVYSRNRTNAGFVD